MKYPIYIVMSIAAFAFMGSACSETDDFQAGEETQTTPLEGIALSLESSQATIETGTRAAVPGYSVNTAADPTKVAPELRTGWKLDFTLSYLSGTAHTVYPAGSFTGGIYDAAPDKGYWRPVPTGGTDKWYYPNYFHPKADLLIYPDPAGAAYPAEVALDQSAPAVLLAQDILFKNGESVHIAHNMIYVANSTKAISVNHQRSMLDFIVSDVVHADIASVTVVVGTGASAKEYVPCKVTYVGATSGNEEYMLILPETTNAPVVVKIKTKENTAAGAKPITYLFTIATGSAPLGSNKCFYFTLSGNLVSLSPVTVTDWTTGEPISGEYIAVTAYPTFKGIANTTYYLYYDNKLTESDGAGGTRPKLQAVTFNDEGECTFKPDGRIITHIGTENDFSKLLDLTTTNPVSTIKLDKMYIDLTDLLNPPG